MKVVTKGGKNEAKAQAAIQRRADIYSRQRGHHMKGRFRAILLESVQVRVKLEGGRTTSAMLGRSSVCLDWKSESIRTLLWQIRAPASKWTPPFRTSNQKWRPVRKSEKERDTKCMQIVMRVQVNGIDTRGRFVVFVGCKSSPSNGSGCGDERKEDDK